MSDNFLDYQVKDENINIENKSSNEYIKELEIEREELYQKIDTLIQKLDKLEQGTIANNVYNNLKNPSNTTKIISLFWSLVTFFAIYLSFKCNNGFSLGGLLAALIFSPFYIAYKLGTHWDVCMGTNSIAHNTT